MSFRSRAWMVAGTVGVVEALKDQGFARWNTTIWTIHRHAKSNLRSIAHAKILTSPAAMASSRDVEEKAKQSEKSLRKVIFKVSGDISNKPVDEGFSRWNCTIKSTHHHEIDVQTCAKLESVHIAI
ncbi:unnamed protein product [Lactuca virosa]|uniref:Wound-responsive family protein n=1 Tax=Lactuca virosa TaxID=75947 RepID=A0AAU9LIB6_9ASTR|nr:unnamed protein product [Lactuca virosa]